MTDRMTDSRRVVPDGRSREMFLHTLTYWAHDVLASSRAIQWPTPDPMEDCHSRDWSSLYAGSILDD